MPILNYYNTKISYTIKGKGFPLVFIHGFAEDSNMWNDFTKHFSDYKILCIDLPGSGISDYKKASIARMAKMLNAVLVQEQIDKCLMVGHSMGGYVNLAFAKLYEAKLLGYCLFHSQPFADTEAKKQTRNKAIDFVKEHGAANFFSTLIPNLFGANFKKDNPLLIKTLSDKAGEMEDRSVIALLEAMRDRPNNQEVLKKSNVPVCFIIGKEDMAIPPKNSIDQTYLPNIADIHILPEIGHMGMFEDEQQTVKILKSFILFCHSLTQ